MNTNEHTEQIVPVGKNIYYDEHASISKRIVNRGSITLAPGITLEAEELINEGTIKSESGDLTLRVEKLTGSGSLTSEGAIDLSSSHDLIVNDGSFAANEVRFDCAGDLNVDARRIEGSVRIKSKNLSFGSREGDLNIIESCTEGDPIVYAEGPLTCGAFNTNNEDLALLAHGTITINGNIDTGTGTLTVGAGVSFVVTGTPQSGPCGAGSQQIDGGSYNIVSSTGVSPFILNGDIKCQGSGNAVRLIASRSEVNGALDIADNLIVQSGNLEVNCPASKTVNVGGFVQSVDGRVIIKAPDASSSISIMGQITAPKQTIILVAGGNIRTGTVSNTHPDNVTDIRIFANEAGGGSPFTIGGSGNANGVNGQILNGSVSGSQPFNETRNIYISNGGDNNNGSAGLAQILADKLPAPTENVYLNANATGSSGNGGNALLFYDTGNVKIGEGPGAFRLNAVSNGTGHGGQAIANAAAANSTLTLDTSFEPNSLNVSALGTNGDGGEIRLIAGTFTNNASGANAALFTTGMGTGKGGKIFLNFLNDITIDAAPGLGLFAFARNTGDGGTIEIVGGAAVTLNSASLSVEAGLDSGSNGKGGSLDARATTNLTASGTFNANGRGSGKGGSLFLFANQTLNIGTSEFHADGGDTGGGGDLTLTGSNSLAIDTSKISAAAGTGTGSNAAGGHISITAAGDTSNLTLSGNLDVSGFGSGGGGSIVLIAGLLLDVASSELQANGGTDGGDGGSISLSYTSEDELVVKDLIATSGSENGGNIAIRNLANADMLIRVVGSIDTSSPESEADFSGRFTLTVANDENNSISMFVDEGGGFDSLFTAEAKALSVTAIPPVNLWIDTIQANNGDVNICAAGTGICVVAIAARRSIPAKFLLDNPSTVGVLQFVKAPNGGITISSEVLRATDSPGQDMIVLLPGENKPVALACTQLKLGANRYIYGSQFANGNISVQSLGSGLTIELADGTTAGFKSANNITIAAGPGADENLTFTRNPATVPSFLSLECTGTCSLFAMGAVVSDLGVGLGKFTGGFVVNTVTPTDLVISSLTSRVELNGPITALSTIDVNTSSVTAGDITVSTVVAGDPTSPGQIHLNAARDLGLFGTVQTAGPITCEAAGVFIAENTARIKALNSGGFSTEKVTIEALDDVGFLRGAQVLAHDEIVIASANIPLKTNPDGALTRPATVDASQVHITSPGQLYWGNVANLNIDGDHTPSFTANGKDLTFAGSIGTINIAPETVFTAGA